MPLSSSLAMLPHIKQLLGEFQSPLLRQVDEEMDTLADLTDLIERAIVKNRRFLSEKEA